MKKMNKITTEQFNTINKIKHTICPGEALEHYESLFGFISIDDFDALFPFDKEYK